MKQEKREPTAEEKGMAGVVIFFGLVGTLIGFGLQGTAQASALGAGVGLTLGFAFIILVAAYTPPKP